MLEAPWVPNPSCFSEMKLRGSVPPNHGGVSAAGPSACASAAERARKTTPNLWRSDGAITSWLK